VKKILIFTAGFGEGHNTAARNVRDALEHIGGSEVSVEVIDLFDECYGRFNDFVRSAYITAINKTPRLWQGIYNILDHTSLMQDNLIALARMKKMMEQLLLEMEPDAVCSTYPVYNYVIDEIYADGRPRNFSQITIVTDSISVNSLWYKANSDYYIVPNEDTGEVLLRAGVDPEKVRVLGFPVQLAFTLEESREKPPALDPKNPHAKILYIINSGKSKAPKIVERLLALPNIDLTITVGRDAKLHQLLAAQTEEHKKRVGIIGWTSKIPQLLMTHHLVISKAGGATVQEAIAAECPMIVNQVVPGQEEGNYELLHRNHCGVLAEKPRDVADWVEKSLTDGGQLLNLWRQNIKKISKPDSALQAARFILEQAVPTNVPPTSFKSRHRTNGFGVHAGSAADPGKKLLLCDLHSHTTFSDGKLTARELVDFYGQRGFDVLGITDHIADPKKLVGKVCNMSGLVLPPNQVAEYFDVLAKEKKRALDKYGMLLMPGLEFNKDGLTAKSSTHLLGVDLREPIDAGQSLHGIIGSIHAQGGLAIAAHPHRTKSHWGKNTLYLWENQDEFAPLIDAWEIGNRDDLFNPIGLKRLPFLASSDFHKPKHIHSWKTVIFAEKNPEAVKECIRANRDLAITLYRDHVFAAASPRPIEELGPILQPLWNRLAAAAA
jgi:processive 1,2-diacylglycerol beta-glucosyltransferase